jgi:hypothetical protein
MTELVSDDVRAREVAGRAESLAQLVEERQVEIDLLVARTVERPGRRLRHATGRLDDVPEQDDASPHVFWSKRFRPRRLDVVRNGVHEFHETLFLRR